MIASASVREGLLGTRSSPQLAEADRPRRPVQTLLVAAWFVAPWAGLAAGGDLKLVDVFLVATACAVLLFHQVPSRTGRLFVPRVARRYLLGLTMVVAGVSAGSLTTAYDLRAITQMLVYGVWAVLPIMILLRVRASDRLLRVLAGAFVLGTIASVLTAPFLGRVADRGRWIGLASHMNQLAATIAISLPLIALGFGGVRSWRSRVTATIVVLVLLAGLEATGSRSGAIAVGIVALALGGSWIRSTHGGLLHPRALVLAAMAVVAFVAVLPNMTVPTDIESQSTIERLSGGGGSENSDDRRANLLEAGVGAAATPGALVGSGYYLEKSPHNAFLEAWLAGGILAALGIAIIVYQPLVAAASGIIRGVGGTSVLGFRFGLSVTAWIVSLFFNNALWARFGWMVAALFVVARINYMAVGGARRSKGPWRN